MSGENPCNVCTYSDDCDGCILNDLFWHSSECYNYACFLHYDCGCLLNLDEKCKASTCFKEPGVWVMDVVEDDNDDE